MENQWEHDHEAAVAAFKLQLKGCTTEDYLGRPYIRRSRLLAWFKSPVPGHPGTTQAGRLLAAAYRDRVNQPVQPITKEKLCDGEDRCLLVFSIFLELDRGQLINRFVRQGKVDKHLPITLADLKNTLTKMGHTRDLEELAVSFHSIQWRYCAPIFELNITRDFPRNQILPIRRKREIATGGTAQLWQIEVLEDFVGPQLRLAVQGSRYDDPNDGLGYRYELALKSFEGGNKHFYINERNAFLALHNQKHIVQYLGEYNHAQPSTDIPQILEPGQGRNSAKITHNILLEYGESDLTEYFADNLPPYFQPEVEAFYKELFLVADAVKSIHNYKINEGGRVMEFAGWHADIKPDNILTVQGRFKLADPGFVKFVRKSGQDPEEVLLGGTATYGAPERLRANGDPNFRFSQSIDTWSLGCVFSIAATWVVLGYQGTLQYSKVRRKAIEKLVQQYSSRSADLPSKAYLINGDYFHDGSEVLPDILKWHNVLRSVLRRTDHVTHLLLDLVDGKMLLGDPKQRIAADKVCEELDLIIKRAASQQRVKVPESISSYLLEVDDLALSKPRDSVAVGSISLQDRPLAIVEERKEKLRVLPLMKTTQRSQVFRSSPTARDKKSGDTLSPVHQHFLAPLYEETQQASRHAVGASEPLHTSVPNPSLPSSPPRPKHSKKPKREAGRTSQNVWQAREELELQREKGGWIKYASKDKILSRYFVNRDIKFLVDNAETMTPFWYEATYLLDTLVMKACGQDKNGMDLQFTSGQVTVDGWEGGMGKMLRAFKADKFNDAMRNVEARPIPGNHTDITISLGQILNAYLSEAKRQIRMNQEPRDLTLIVLTDGIWAGTKNKDAVRSLIVNFSKKLMDIFSGIKQRPVSIEFIQFGHDEDATNRLWILDNRLEGDGIPDIIDTEQSSGDVYKMLLGSFVAEFDERDQIYETENNEISTPSPTLSDSYHTTPGLARSATQYNQPSHPRIQSRPRSSTLHTETLRSVSNLAQQGQPSDGISRSGHSFQRSSSIKTIRPKRIDDERA